MQGMQGPNLNPIQNPQQMAFQMQIQMQMQAQAQARLQGVVQNSADLLTTVAPIEASVTAPALPPPRAASGFLAFPPPGAPLPPLVRF